MLPKTVISRYSNTYAKKPKRLGVIILPLGRLKMVTFTYSNILLSVIIDIIYAYGVYGCGHIRPLGLFEVLTRNRQSAVELLGGTLRAREQTPRVFTILPRQRLSSPRRLVSRRWNVMHIRRIRRRGRGRRRFRRLGRRRILGRRNAARVMKKDTTKHNFSLHKNAF